MSERKRPENNIGLNNNMPPAKKIHRTRQLFRLGLDARLEALAIAQGRALRKQKRPFQVEYEYFIENDKKKVKERKKLYAPNDSLQRKLNNWKTMNLALWNIFWLII